MYIVKTVKYQKEFFINIANCLSSETRKHTDYFAKLISATVVLGNTCQL